MSWKTSIVIVVAAACSSTTPGARPHDMSAAEHHRAADQHVGTADTHATQHDPNATVERRQCGGGGGLGGGGLRGGGLQRSPICWTSVENPTAEHLVAAKEHRRHAADHRAASIALREAEARTCIGIGEDDRDISPFDRIEDIASVAPLKEAEARKVPMQRTVGAIVTFHARPGMTAEWLQRVVDCHVARSAALGHVMPEMPNCPLVPKGVQATVTSTGNGFAVTIRSDDLTVAQEILERARRSKPGPVAATPTR